MNRMVLMCSWLQLLDESGTLLCAFICLLSALQTSGSIIELLVEKLSSKLQGATILPFELMTYKPTTPDPECKYKICMLCLS